MLHDCYILVRNSRVVGILIVVWVGTWLGNFTTKRLLQCRPKTLYPALSTLERLNPWFGFSQPTHSLFGYFNRFVDQHMNLQDGKHGSQGNMQSGRRIRENVNKSGMKTRRLCWHFECPGRLGGCRNGARLMWALYRAFILLWAGQKERIRVAVLKLEAKTQRRLGDQASAPIPKLWNLVRPVNISYISQFNGIRKRNRDFLRYSRCSLCTEWD